MLVIRRDYIDWSAGQLHLRRCGDPADPAVMLLHMSPKSSRSFARVMPAIASEGRFVIAPDYPGYGESDALPDGEAVTVERYAEACWAVADALGTAKLDVIGHHTGSKVAVEMAFERPDLVGKLVLISAAVLTPEEQRQFGAAYEPIPLDDDGTRFRKMWSLIREHRGPGMTLEMMAEALAENLRGGERYEDGHHAAFAYNAVFAERAAELSQSVHVINPKDDLWSITPRAVDLFADARIEDHPEWGHGFLSAFPDDAAAAILRGLR